MCRLGFYIGEKKDITKQVLLATANWSKSNSHGTGIAWKDDDNNTIVLKQPIEATHFWDRNSLTNVNTDKSIFHVRFATTGEHTISNTHPFYDKLTGYSLVHNGVITGYADAKTELKEKGFSFQGECDSEVLLWAYVYKGIDFIDWLKEKGVSGSANILIMKDNEIVVYTNNGSLELFKTPDGIFGFSDDVLGYHELYNHYEIEQNAIYKITKKQVRCIKDKTKLKEYSYPKGIYSEYKSYFTKDYAYDMQDYYQTKFIDNKKEETPKDIKVSTHKKVSKKDKQYIRAWCKKKYGVNWYIKYLQELELYKASLQDNQDILNPIFATDYYA